MRLAAAICSRRSPMSRSIRSSSPASSCAVRRSRSQAADARRALREVGRLAGD
jgi:hypothetical protein